MKPDRDTKLVIDEFDRKYGKSRNLFGQEVQEALLASVVMYFMSMRYDGMKESPEKYPATHYVELYGKASTFLFGD